MNILPETRPGNPAGICSTPVATCREVRAGTRCVSPRARTLSLQPSAVGALISRRQIVRAFSHYRCTFRGGASPAIRSRAVASIPRAGMRWRVVASTVTCRCRRRISSSPASRESRSGSWSHTLDPRLSSVRGPLTKTERGSECQTEVCRCCCRCRSVFPIKPLRVLPNRGSRHNIEALATAA